MISWLSLLLNLSPVLLNKCFCMAVPLLFACQFSKPDWPVWLIHSIADPYWRTKKLCVRPSVWCSDSFSACSGLQCNYRAIGKGFQVLLVQLHQVHASCKCLWFYVDFFMSHHWTVLQRLFQLWLYSQWSVSGKTSLLIWCNCTFTDDFYLFMKMMTRNLAFICLSRGSLLLWG